MKDYRFCPLCGAGLGQRPVDGRIRPACSSELCDFVYWNNPVPVVAAIIELEGRVLLVRSAGWPAGMFGLVTGFLESGETPEEGVVREIREETGLSANEPRFLGCFSFHQANQLLLGFHVRASGILVLSDELEESRLVERERLKPWPFGTGVIVRSWLESSAKDAF